VNRYEEERARVERLRRIGCWVTFLGMVASAVVILFIAYGVLIFVFGIVGA
jgi:hypothetical protein